MRKKRARSKKADFTRAPRPSCTLYTIEAVMRETDLDHIGEDADAIQSALDTLRGIGCATLIKKELIAEDFDTACDILDNRKHK